MVQAFSKLQWIDQCAAGTIITVKPFQIAPCNQERGNPPSVIADPNFGQIAAHAQQKCASKQVGHFKGALQKVSPPFN